MTEEASAKVQEPVSSEQEIAEIRSQLESLPTPLDSVQPEIEMPEEKVAEEKAVQPADKTTPKAEEIKQVEDTEGKPEKLTNEDWAAARVAAGKKLEKERAEYSEKERKYQQELADLKKQMEELKTPRQPEAQKLPPEQVFARYHDALSGKFGNAEQADSVARAAKTIIGRMNISDLQRVVTHAESGAFGGASGEIAELARSEMGPASVRWINEQRSREEQSAKVSDWRTRNAQSFGKVVNDFPELKDPNSEFGKAFQAMRDKYIGTFDAKGNALTRGPLFGLHMEPDWPERLAPVFTELLKAQKTSAAIADAETKAKETEIKRSPESGGHSGATQSPSEIDAIKKQLREMGNIGPGG